MVFIGLRALKVDSDQTIGKSWTKARVIHFNPSWIAIVDEKEMMIQTHDGLKFRIDEESLQIFLSAVYGDLAMDENRLREE